MPQAQIGSEGLAGLVNNAGGAVTMGYAGAMMIRLLIRACNYLRATTAA